MMTKFPTSYKIAFSPDNSLFVRVAGSTFVYSGADFRQIYRFISPIHPCDAAFSPDSSLLAIISTTGRLRVYSMSDGAEVFSYNLRDSYPAPRLVFTTNDTFFVYCNNGDAWAFRVGCAPVKLDSKKIDDLFFRTADSRLFSYYHHGKTAQAQIKEYTSGTPETVMKVPADKGVVSEVFLSKEHLCVLSSGFADEYENGSIPELEIVRRLDELLRDNEPQEIGTRKFFYNYSFFERATGKPVGKLTTTTEINESAIAISPDSAKIALALHGKVFLITWSGTEEILDIGDEVISMLEFTRDGRQLLVGTWQHGYVI